MWSVDNCRDCISKWTKKTIYSPDLDYIDLSLIKGITDEYKSDYRRYYNTDEFRLDDIIYYPGLIATFFYRVSRFLYLSGFENQAREFSSIGFALSHMEIYYSSSIKEGLKINHGIGTVIGARVQIGKNVLLHHNVTLGDRNGGRPTLGDNVTIYPGAVVIGNIEIGNYSIIGANATVLKSAPENSIITGVFK